MTQPRWWFFGAALSVTLLVAGPALAQTDPQTKNDSATQDTASRPSPSNPGPEHARLADLAGEYTRVVKFVGQPGAASAPSTGTAKISVILGGRFLLEKSKDTVFGRPVDGLRLYGYNNVTKQYEMARMYTMSTAMTMMTGTSTDGGKTIDFTGSTESPGTGRLPLHAHLERVSDDAFVVTLSTVGADGKDEPFQETDYTRKK